MNRQARRPSLSLFGAGLALCAGLCHADNPVPREFAWRASLEVPAGASLVRTELTAQALLRLQSRDARDLRIDKRKVRLEQPLREVGTFMGEIELADGTVAAVKTIISEEK